MKPNELPNTIRIPVRRSMCYKVGDTAETSPLPETVIAKEYKVIKDIVIEIYDSWTKLMYDYIEPTAVVLSPQAFYSLQLITQNGATLESAYGRIDILINPHTNTPFTFVYNRGAFRERT